MKKIILLGVAILGIFNFAIITNVFANDEIETSKTHNTSKISIKEIEQSLEQLSDRGMLIRKIKITSNFCFIGQKLVNGFFPSNCLVILIVRDNNFVIPKGNTEILENDMLYLILEEQALEKINDMFIRVAEETTEN